MDEGENHKTRKILDLTLEIIYLLTGEDYIVIKKTLVTSMAPSRLPLLLGGWSRSQSIIMEPPPHCFILERNKGKDILEVTQKIIGLLTGEDKNHGGHKDLEKDIIVDSWEVLKSPDSLCRENHLTAPSLDLQKSNPRSCSPEEPKMVHAPDMTERRRQSGSSTAEVHAQTECPVNEGIGLCVEDRPVAVALQQLYKKESALCKEEGWACPTQCSTSDHIKEEPASSDEDNLSDGEHISVIVEEPHLGDEEEEEEHPAMEDQAHTGIYNTDTDIQSDHSKCFICNQDFSPQEMVHVEGGLYPYTTCGTCFADHTTQRTTHMVDKRYSCSECGKSFANNSHLVRHQRVHSGDKPYSCLDCGRSFANSSHLVRHRRVHTGDKPYSCLQCGRCFSNSSHLVIHQRVHTGDKPYSCDECGKSFGTKQNMDRHKRIHTGEKPFDCPVCKRSFAHKSAMIKHERIHTGERPYICGKCGKGFVAKSELVKHERTHTGEKPYECSECGKRFSRNYELGLHRKIHTGEKPHCCPQCGKWFLRKYEFILHERTHTGETPYCCSICGKGFSHRTNFSRHLSTHTSYNP